MTTESPAGFDVDAFLESIAERDNVYRFRCHWKCGAAPQRRLDKLHAAARLAIGQGRSDVWLR